MCGSNVVKLIFFFIQNTWKNKVYHKLKQRSINLIERDIKDKNIPIQANHIKKKKCGIHKYSDWLIELDMQTKTRASGMHTSFFNSKMHNCKNLNNRKPMKCS